MEIAGEIAKDREGITGIKYISFMNIRVAHEKKRMCRKNSAFSEGRRKYL